MLNPGEKIINYEAYARTILSNIQSENYTIAAHFCKELLESIEEKRKQEQKFNEAKQGGLLTCTRCGETTPRPECASKDCKWLCHDCWQNPKRKVKSK
jgi:formylmethanofuran dehydrogenase subunit E